MFKRWFSRYKPLTQYNIMKAIEQSSDSALPAAIEFMLLCAFEAGYRRGLNARKRS